MKKVLLVEDEPAVASYLTMCLQHEGFQISHVPTLADARSALNEGFDLVLLDLMLPDGTGDELVTELRAGHPHTPVLIVSGVEPEDERLVRCLKLGAAGFVRKTERIEELMRTIGRAITR